MVGVFSLVVKDRKALLDGLLGSVMGRRVWGSMAYGALWDSNRKHNTSSQVHCLRHYASDKSKINSNYFKRQIINSVAESIKLSDENPIIWLFFQLQDLTCLFLFIYSSSHLLFHYITTLLTAVLYKQLWKKKPRLQWRSVSQSWSRLKYPTHR